MQITVVNCIDGMIVQLALSKGVIYSHNKDYTLIVIRSVISQREMEDGMVYRP